MPEGSLCEFVKSGLGIAVCVNPYRTHTGLYNHKPSNVCFVEVHFGWKTNWGKRQVCS